ncbi:DUF2487 family protein [Priestia filamentosa]|uniref:DUF2487 family protein n=1 Tax=Priestia TaxID=2800373 RepID=UPI0022830252|nr:MULTISPECIES: DUF2487 family protein [Priestia]MCY8232733.1 YpiF family protein [Priestia endophytica]MED3725119.1 DUF2487 family protein [Priestia filamentosa]
MLKWNSSDVGIYLAQKEYIDTIIVPLHAVNFVDEVKKNGFLWESMIAITNEIEHRFKGRVMLCPPFTYHSKEPSVTARLEQWIEDFYDGEAKHILFLTSDKAWQQEQVKGSVVFVPFEMQETEKGKKEAIMIQVEKVTKSLLGMWK